MSTDLFSAIDSLVPAAPDEGRWNEVLERAGVRRSTPRRASWAAVALVGAARPTAAVTVFSPALSPIIWWRTSTAFLSDRFSSRRRP